MSKRIDLTVTSTRPDLEVSVQMPGAYIIRDGKAIPDLNDEAMAKREEIRNKKSEIGSEEAEEKKTDEEHQ